MEPPSTPPSGTFWTELAWISLAVVGGVARYLDTYLKGGTAPKWGMILANGFVSGFAGYMASAIALKVQPDWAFVAAGIGGYLGTQGLDWISTVVKTRFERASDIDLDRQKRRAEHDHDKAGEP